jgi:ATP-dependent helicase HepA
MQQLWDYFGLDCETHSEHAVVVRPSDHMLVSHFPGLPEDGLTACFDRAQALGREDMAFFTWEHPMVQAAMDMILGAEYGNACVATINIKGLQPGTLLLEAVFSVHSPAPKRLQVEKYLPLSPLRVLVDRSGKNLAEILPHARLNGLSGAVSKQTAPAILKQLGDDIDLLVGHAQRLVQTQLPPLISAARAALAASLDAEISRLRALARVNPAIRAEEIVFLEQQRAAGDAAIARAELELQALRLVINTCVTAPA